MVISQHANIFQLYGLQGPHIPVNIQAVLVITFLEVEAEDIQTHWISKKSYFRNKMSRTVKRTQKSIKQAKSVLT